ncbi:Lrp/AsnC family transcriptional regulator [Bacteroides ihuae]|uniref:Lrp/AsnC family transcriptional regulator n=1 Tax=Bacteroides ihuae TaxID=1852362 RepID=UPI0008D92059|nr:Lrp/AsnC family transcriptional regulator [Bacteroides ihuae]
MEKLDQTDLKLLKLLQEDSSLTTKELAQRVNLSPTPVFERVKQLEREGFIKKYVAILDPEKLSKGFIVFCNIRLKQHSKEYGHQFMEAIMGIDEITECYNISGDYDFMLKIYVPNMKYYQDFVLNKLGTVDSIGSLQSIFVMGEIKQTHSIPLGDVPVK